MARTLVSHTHIPWRTYTYILKYNKCAASCSPWQQSCWESTLTEVTNTGTIVKQRLALLISLMALTLEGVVPSDRQQQHRAGEKFNSRRATSGERAGRKAAQLHWWCWSLALKSAVKKENKRNLRKKKEWRSNCATSKKEKLVTNKDEAKIIMYQPRSLTAIGSAPQARSSRAHNAAVPIRTRCSMPAVTFWLKSLRAFVSVVRA